MSDDKIMIKKLENDTRFVTSKLEEEYKLADGTMLEVRRHEFHAGEQAAENYKKANKSASVKSISGKKAEKLMQANKEKLEKLRQEGDLDSFILNGELVQKTAVSNANMAKDMEENMLTYEEAKTKAEMLKAKIDKLDSLPDAMNGDRMELARNLKKLYAEGMIEDEASTRAIEQEYGPLCDYILQENEYIFDDKFYKPFTTFRKEAGRLQKKDGSLYDSEKKWDEQKRTEYQKDTEYYDYIAQLEKTEKQKAIDELGIRGDKDKMAEFEDRFNLLKVYHLHKAKEANRKIDLVKWYHTEVNEDGDEDFLGDEPIYAEEQTKQTYPLF